MEVTMKATEKDLRDLRGSDVILVMSSCGFVRYDYLSVPFYLILIFKQSYTELYKCLALYRSSL